MDNVAKNLPLTKESIERERSNLHTAFEFDPIKREQAEKSALPAEKVFAEVYEKHFGKKLELGEMDA